MFFILPVSSWLGSADFRQTRAEIALAAALVHDVGHGPFSHAFEDVGKRLSLKMAKHETVSGLLIRNTEIADTLNTLGSGFANDVASVLKVEKPSIYEAVVSSQFDADRLDYVQRDRLMTGTGLGAIDFRWLLANLKVGKVPIGVDEESVGEVDTFVIGAKAISAVEGYILGLFQMYPTVYFHKTTRGTQKVFTELLFRLLKHIQDGSLASIGLTANHPLVKFARRPDSIENFLRLDDTVVWGCLSQLADAKEPTVSELANRLLHRRLYKSTDLRDRLSEIFGVKQRAKIDRACAEIQAKVDEWSADHGGDLPRIIYDEEERHPYTEFRQSRGPVPQIRVQSGTGSVDIAERSEVLSGLQSFKLFRLYHRDEDAEAKQFIEAAIGDVSHGAQQRGSRDRARRGGDAHRKNPASKAGLHSRNRRIERRV